MIVLYRSIHRRNDEKGPVEWQFFFIGTNTKSHRRSLPSKYFPNTNLIRQLTGRFGSGVDDHITFSLFSFLLVYTQLTRVWRFLFATEWPIISTGRISLMIYCNLIGNVGLFCIFVSCFNTSLLYILVSNHENSFDCLNNSFSQIFSMFSCSPYMSASICHYFYWMVSNT
jgi:hypothetical protein